MNVLEENIDSAVGGLGVPCIPSFRAFLLSASGGLVVVGAFWPYLQETNSESRSNLNIPEISLQKIYLCGLFDLL